jgi:hypothetical protein
MFNFTFTRSFSIENRIAFHDSLSHCENCGARHMENSVIFYKSPPPPPPPIHRKKTQHDIQEGIFLEAFTSIGQEVNLECRSGYIRT